MEMDKIRELIQLVEDSQIQEIELSQRGETIRISKGMGAVPIAPAPPAPVPVSATPQPAPPAAAPEAPAPSPGTPTGGPETPTPGPDTPTPPGPAVTPTPTPAPTPTPTPTPSPTPTPAPAPAAKQEFQGHYLTVTVDGYTVGGAPSFGRNPSYSCSHFTHSGTSYSGTMIDDKGSIGTSYTCDTPRPFVCCY